MYFVGCIRVIFKIWGFCIISDVNKWKWGGVGDEDFN